MDYTGLAALFCLFPAAPLGHVAPLADAVEIGRTCWPAEVARAAMEDADSCGDALDGEIALYEPNAMYGVLRYYHSLLTRRAAYRWYAEVYYEMVMITPPDPEPWRLPELRRLLGDDAYYRLGREAVPAWPAIATGE